MAWKKTKTRVGLVVSNKMQKTVVVAVEAVKRHPLYRKTTRLTRKYKVHDEEQRCQIGDQVKIAETRPLSKEKRWRVVEVLVQGKKVTLPEEEKVDSNLHPTEGSG